MEALGKGRVLKLNNTTMTHRLTKDHFSISKPSCRYGKKGDKVKIVYEQNATCIVENEQKERFHIRYNLLEPIKT